MRHNFFGDPIMQPGDTRSDLNERWETILDDNPLVTIYNQPDDDYGYNGEVVSNEDMLSFDGFDSKEAAADFVVEVLGIPRGEIQYADA